MAENQSRSWLAWRVAEEARWANISNCSPMRVSASPRKGGADGGEGAPPLHARGAAAGGVAAPRPRKQEGGAEKHEEGKIAVPAVVTMEEAAFLTAVQRDVGVVEIKHDLLRRALV